MQIHCFQRGLNGQRKEGSKGQRENSGQILKCLILSLSLRLPLKQTEQNKKTVLDNGG